MQGTPTRVHDRRRLALVVAVVFVVGVGIGLLLSGGGAKRLAPARGPAGDPLAWQPGRDATFESRAAAGESHVLYAKSPGGAIATAARVAHWRPIITAAARRYGVSPDDLEALVFLESAGRPNACASNDLSGACGLTQILAGTATGLLGMHVDLPASRRLTKRIRRNPTRALLARRMRVDERFDPRKAIGGAGRYLQIARGHLQRSDLALESYHMGIGNLQNALRGYGSGNVSYTRLYFDSTPLRHPAAYGVLASLGDDSATYLWRLRAAAEIMRMARVDAAGLARLQALHGRKATAEEVLHPLARTKVFQTPADIARGGVVPLPKNASELHLSIDPGMGVLGKDPQAYRALRPEALALLVYLAAGVHEISGQSPLNVTSTVRDQTYQQRLMRRNIEATRAYSLHTTGYAFDIERRYRSPRQAVAFQFMLDRLQALNMIAYAREPRAIHITVSSDARVLLPLLKNRVK
jgi:hypothetical protein